MGVFVEVNLGPFQKGGRGRGSGPGNDASPRVPGRQRGGGLLPPGSTNVLYYAHQIECSGTYRLCEIKAMKRRRGREHRTTQGPMAGPKGSLSSTLGGSRHLEEGKVPLKVKGVP